jgi:hypothetical protein
MTASRHPFRALTICAVMALAAPSAHAAAAAAPETAANPKHDGSHDFDFEFGDWTAHLKRRHPLTGSNDWVDYDGPSIVRKVWGGKANLGEIEFQGPAGHIEGMSLRLYNPDTRQWNITFANSKVGATGTPMIGGFAGGIGEFYGPDTLDGRPIFVRFIFSDITARTFKLEQAFSDDGGKSWEANWIATFTRV